MTLPEPILAFWVASLGLNARVSHTPWGAIVTDERYPRVYEANHASVLRLAPELTLDEIRADLLPALAEAGAAHEHIEFMDADDDSLALRDLMASTGEQDPHVVMVHESGNPARHGRRRSDEQSGIRVEEVTQPDESFWERYRLVPNEYGESLPDDVLDQMVARVRELFLPGERFFVATVEAAVAGIVSVFTIEGVACVDNVVTLDPFRGRGAATATVTRAVSASLDSGAELVFLLAEQDGAARRLYERLGFRVRARCCSFTRPLHEGLLAG